MKACQQLVLPKQCRKVVLRLAHAVPMAGHLGTKNGFLQRYYWPRIFKDVAEYRRSCEVCRKSNPRQPARAEMIPMPLMTQPFQRTAMDIIGPLARTQRGNRFILTIVDYATRYPGAVALSSVEAHRIAKELKELLLCAPVLSIADPEKPFVLQTDASDRVLGAVLSQKDERAPSCLRESKAVSTRN